MARPLVTRSAPPRGTEASDPRLEIVVIHSQTRVTLTALRAAAALAKDLGAGIRLLAPHVVPYPLPLEASPLPAEYACRQCRTLVDGLAIPTRIESRLCRDTEEAVISALAPHSLVVMARKRIWKWSWEPSLAKTLRRLGHHVVLPE